MKVTRVKLFPAKKGVIRAIVEITLDDCWVIHGLKVLRHDRGYVVSMPHKKWRKGGKYRIAFPITDEARRMIENAVMAEYNETISYSAAENKALNMRICPSGHRFREGFYCTTCGHVPPREARQSDHG
jgi:stage V sporulation protein G